MSKVYINKKERESLHVAWDYVNNLLEACIADEGSSAITNLQTTMDGLQSIISKVKRN